MNEKMKKLFISFGLLLYIGLNTLLAGDESVDEKKIEMIQDLEVIRHHFEIGYAPAAWKKEYIGWDLNEAFEQAKNQILEAPGITTKQFQQIVRRFLGSMKDYHVNLLLYSTESASLPFTAKGAEGRYFIQWVDPVKLPENLYGIQVGDELLGFDGLTIDRVLDDLERQSGRFFSSKTDWALAELKLTKRMGMMGDTVPKGSVLVTTKSKETGKISTRQLLWEYHPEYIKNFHDIQSFLEPKTGSIALRQHKKNIIQYPKIMLLNYAHKIYLDTNDPSQTTDQERQLPKLGEVIFDMGSYWDAYIYLNAEGLKIGYIRIPSYDSDLDDLNVKAFSRIIEFLNEHTDALVIDQLNNLGGSVELAYKLASMLTSAPLDTPHHRFKITQSNVLFAIYQIKFINSIHKMMINQTKRMKTLTNHHLMLRKTDESDVDEREEENQSNNEAENEDEDEDVDNPFNNYQRSLYLKAHYEFLLEEWNSGHALTGPTHILGIDKINPHAKYCYTKPILMLINELCSSGGDFMPAILQDNSRAVLFGAQTAGAGGAVSFFEFPNKHGIRGCTYTSSIAERPNSQKIENLGVSPDIVYEVTADDLQNDYRGYIQAVNEAVTNLLIR